MDLHKEYDSYGESIQEFFREEGVGFFVPLYQREYTWEGDNIDQLFEDLIHGVGELVEGKNPITFLGTAILTRLNDRRRTVFEGQERAQPTAVELVIDGQQRISTLALISIQLTEKLKFLINKLPYEVQYTDFHHSVKSVIEKLRKLHTVNLERGSPQYKPIIIREHDERWTYDGEDDKYKSPVARYIAHYIRYKDANSAISELSQLSGSERVRRNVNLIDWWIDSICDAHIPDSSKCGQYPVGEKIATESLHEFIFNFPDSGIIDIVKSEETDKHNNNYICTAIYQANLLVQYLLRRCGINRLQPSQEEWGFDMFQALNATGTPLTVIETFLPKVMQVERDCGNEWSDTPSSGYMDDVQDFLGETSTNEQKNKRTNELISTFALCHGGERLANKFSEQRRWLTGNYDSELLNLEEKRNLLEKLSKVANFFINGWYMESPTKPFHINGLEDHTHGELASLLVKYLKDANSRLSAPILARFYSDALSNNCSFDDFVEVTKVCAAFFTLWRSTNSTSGLDDIYRKFFQGSGSPIKVEAHNWNSHPGRISVDRLKEYFLNTLKNNGIADKQQWISASEQLLLFTENRTICRFILFVAGHDQEADESRPGLTEQGRPGTCPLLKRSVWDSLDYKSVEHIAPKITPGSGQNWDTKIYELNLVHQIGNLMLLPVELNTMVDNKDWSVKYLYYCHVGVRRQIELDGLTNSARNNGIVLSKKAIKKLSNANHKCAVSPILKVGETGGVWNAEIIQKRSLQLQELAFDMLFSWLKI